MWFWLDARPGRPGRPAVTWPRTRTRRGWPCSTCPARGWKARAARGYSRDGKKGKLQIEYGLLTDPGGRPVAVRVFPGSTGDPTAFTQIVQVVRDKFGLRDMVMVGDRGMITSARIAALNQAGGGTPRPDRYGWITALRAPAIRKLMADDGPLQLWLFDEQDLAEITCDDFPGERLVACRNPVLAAERARKREDLLAATEKLLAPIAARVAAGRLAGAAAIGVEAGKVIAKYKTAKHFQLTITDTSLAVAAARTRSTPRPPWTGSMCCAPPFRPATWTPPPWWPPTRTSNTSPHRGAVTVPVLHGRRLIRASHVQVRQDERVGVDRPGTGQFGERQGALVWVQGPAAPGARVGRDLFGVQRHPADQQRRVRRPPVRAVPGDGDLGAVHVDRVVPVVLGDVGQQPPQRRNPLGADREGDLLVVRGAGQRPGEVPGIGAQPHPARSPYRRRQGSQRAAQQIRRGRARVIGPVAQVGGQHGLGLGPGGHVRAADPLALMVIGHAPLLPAVDLHIFFRP